jgi:hypothetical protein
LLLWLRLQLLAVALQMICCKMSRSRTCWVGELSLLSSSSSGSDRLMQTMHTLSGGAGGQDRVKGLAGGVWALQP